MTEDNQTSIIVSLISGAFLILASAKSLFVKSIWQNIKNFLKNKESDKFINSLHKMYRIYECLDKICYETNVERVILFSGHNCGGKPEVYKPYSVSSLYGVGVRKDILDNYQNLSIDSFYVKMLLESINNGSIHIKYDDMPECQLKTYYSLEGIREAYIFFVDIVENNLIYISAASKKDNVLNKDDVTFINLQVNTMKNLLRQE